jgi:hypothetical protein
VHLRGVGGGFELLCVLQSKRTVQLTERDLQQKIRAITCVVLVYVRVKSLLLQEKSNPAAVCAHSTTNNERLLGHLTTPCVLYTPLGMCVLKCFYLCVLLVFSAKLYTYKTSAAQPQWKATTSTKHNAEQSLRRTCSEVADH